MSLKSNFNELYDNGHTRPDIGKIEWTIWKRFREVKEQHEQVSAQNLLLSAQPAIVA
jgi:hypothetical protein